MVIDVFNGDADGICALHQLRLVQPRPEARLVTGVKRDIQLLKLLAAEKVSNTLITVLDISLDSNRIPLEQLLDLGNTVFYADHHYSGEIPANQNLETHLHPDPEICTSFIISRLIGDAHLPWAIAGAFGDNLDEVALVRAREAGLTEEQTEQLREIGVLLNYNGYGFSLDDLHLSPDMVYTDVHQYTDACTFYRQSVVFKKLRNGYKGDMDLANKLTAAVETDTARIFELPNAAWARRIVGVFSNQMAREKQEKAHATMIRNTDGSYRISVRAPLSNRQGADGLCRQFPTGGGRAAAAGVNALPPEQKDLFISTLLSHF
ncbi:MAG: acetyltransferase [Desulfobulbus propionicus]|nr:MAG: acetyltransferase [Desulfobulbus propionicus]